jgi:hypothetical protein
MKQNHKEKLNKEVNKATKWKLPKGSRRSIDTVIIASSKVSISETP